MQKHLELCPYFGHRSSSNKYLLQGHMLVERTSTLHKPIKQGQRQKHTTTE